MFLTMYRFALYFVSCSSWLFRGSRGRGSTRLPAPLHLQQVRAGTNMSSVYASAFERACTIAMTRTWPLDYVASSFVPAYRSNAPRETSCYVVHHQLWFCFFFFLYFFPFVPSEDVIFQHAESSLETTTVTLLEAGTKLASFLPCCADTTDRS